MDIKMYQLRKVKNSRFGSKSTYKFKHFPSPLEQAFLTHENHLLLQFKPKPAQERHLHVFCSSSH